MDKEKALENMTGLLLSKARMLQYHCANCKSPLFEKDEKIICPVCGEMEVKKEKAEKGEKEGKQTSKTSSVLLKKRDELLAKIEHEKNPKKLTDLLEALEKINKSL